LVERERERERVKVEPTDEQQCHVAVGGRLGRVVLCVRQGKGSQGEGQRDLIKTISNTTSFIVVDGGWVVFRPPQWEQEGEERNNR